MKTFPWKLHEMLETADREGFDKIVSWLPDGKSFKVHKPQDFVKTIMRKYFHQSKYKSFQRQLNLWGFVRISQGLHKGGYTHTKYFFRHDRSELMKMKRLKKKDRESPPSRKSKSTRMSQKATSVVTESTKPPFNSSGMITIPNVENNTAVRGDVSSISSESEWEKSPTTTSKLDYNEGNNQVEESNLPRSGDCIDFEGRGFFFIDEDEIESNRNVDCDVDILSFPRPACNSVSPGTKLLPTLSDWPSRTILPTPRNGLSSHPIRRVSVEIPNSSWNIL